MIKEVYQRLFKNISPLLSSNDVLIYSKKVPLLNEYLQKASVDTLETFEIKDISKYSLVVIDPSMELSELSRDFLKTLVDSGKPIILPCTSFISSLKKDLNFYYYDIYLSGKKDNTLVTIRQLRDCQSYLNFYIRFQEDNRLQRFLDNDQSNSFMELFYHVLKDFYDIRARLVYPFEYGGHSGSFILGTSHANWHTYPEKGEVVISINSCSNKNPVPLLKNALIDMFRLNPNHVYSDYKEVDIHF